VVTARELVEACEALPGQPWPARFSARALPDRLELSVSEDTAGSLSAEELARHIAADAHGLAVSCNLVAGPASAALRPLRADLRETSFSPERT
jgi:hypothetical protein